MPVKPKYDKNGSRHFGILQNVSMGTKNLFKIYNLAS